MNFKIYFKDLKNETYYLKEISDKENYDYNFYFKLKIQTELQIQNIRDDILYLLKDDDIQNLSNPRSQNFDNQKIINILVKYRKNNQIVLEELKALLSRQDTIICTNCQGIMRKIPIGINYKRVGDQIIIKEINKKNEIKWIYSCDKCPLAIEEDIYLSNIGK